MRQPGVGRGAKGRDIERIEVKHSDGACRLRAGGAAIAQRAEVIADLGAPGRNIPRPRRHPGRPFTWPECRRPPSATSRARGRVRIIEGDGEPGSPPAHPTRRAGGEVPPVQRSPGRNGGRNSAVARSAVSQTRGARREQEGSSKAARTSGGVSRLLLRLCRSRSLPAVPTGAAPPTLDPAPQKLKFWWQPRINGEETPWRFPLPAEA